MFWNHIKVHDNIFLKYHHDLQVVFSVTSLRCIRLSHPFVAFGRCLFCLECFSWLQRSGFTVHFVCFFWPQMLTRSRSWWINGMVWSHSNIDDNITLLTVSVYLFFKHHDLLAACGLLSVACVSLLTTSRYVSKIKMWYLMIANCFVFTKHVHWMTWMLFILHHLDLRYCDFALRQKKCG